MVFSDTTTKAGLIQDCEQGIFGNYGEISGSPNKLYEWTVRLNRSLDKAVGKILGWDGKWQFDDSNYTDIPIGSTSLVSGQSDYTISVTHLEIIRVSILDSDGNVKILDSIDELDDEMRTKLESTTTGTPTHYDKKGSSIILFPTPNYSIASGLTVRFQRGPSYYVYTDTTKTPGFASIFHPYVSLDAKLGYAIDKQLPQAANLASSLAAMEEDMSKFFGRRAKDEPRRLKPKVEDTK